jgi:hypothetical protein
MSAPGAHLERQLRDGALGSISRKEWYAMRRGFSEALMSAGTVAVLLLVLVVLDGRVRDEISLRIARPSAELAGAGRQVSDITSIIAGAVRDQSLAHAPLLIFALAATVLVLLMLRT